MEENGRRYLSREAILALAGQLERKVLYVPELGGDVIVQEMTAAERDEYEASVIKGRGKDLEVVMRGLRAKLVIRSLVGEDGQRIFTEADHEAVSALGARAIDRIFAEAQEVNGLTKKDIEELAGNSESVRSEEPASASL